MAFSKSGRRGFVHIAIVGLGLILLFLTLLYLGPEKGLKKFGLFGQKKGEQESKAATINTDTSYQMPVLVLAYLPTQDGVNLDGSITGISATLANMRDHVKNISNETLQALVDGSRYHAYGNNSIPPAMNYSILSQKEYLEALPLGLPLKPGIYRPDYRKILERENICNLVDNQGLQEVWLFGYHYGNIEPVESNMAGPHGDISNSERTDDIPVCSKTYVLYNYNYGRGSNEATHNHGHQIEVVLKYFGDPLFESNFIGPWNTYGSNDGSGSNFHRCGWTHTPPNTGGEYDFTNTRFSWTDCTDWKPDGSGNKVNINCDAWSCNERLYHVWRWQGMPGRNNGISGVTNWWDFIGNFDGVWQSHQKLVYDTGSLSASPTLSPSPSPSPSVEDTVTPTVLITLPTEGAVVIRTKYVPISISANDNVEVTKVEVYINNSMKCLDISAPYECEWKVPGKKNATYEMTAKAYDAAGNVGVQSITVRSN